MKKKGITVTTPERECPAPAGRVADQCADRVVSELEEAVGANLIVQAPADALREATPTQCCPTIPKKTGMAIIAAERYRQIKGEGWTAAHDAEHRNGELAQAAACYALPYPVRRAVDQTGLPLWPFAPQWWKPTPADRIRELAKAGALIAAEIDRLQNL